jgi:hypothetical protein
MKPLLTVLSFFVIASATHAAVFTNSPSVDSFVRAAAPTLNYGGAGSLSVSGSTATNGSGVTNGVFDTFMRFNTAAMVSNFNSLFGTNNWVINGASLQVTEMGAPAQTLFNRGQGAFDLRWIANDNWTEGTGMPMTPTTNGITYNNELNDLPPLVNPLTDADLGTFTNAGVDGVLTFALALPTAFANDLGAGGEVGFYFTAIDPGIGFTFNSRSFMTNSARPVLKISAVPRPAIVSITFSGSDVVLAAINGVAGGTYYTLSSTNITQPLSQWLPVATNVLSANGAFTNTIPNAAAPNAPSPQFFILQTQ